MMIITRVVMAIDDFQSWMSRNRLGTSRQKLFCFCFLRAHLRASKCIYLFICLVAALQSEFDIEAACLLILLIHDSNVASERNPYWYMFLAQCNNSLHGGIPRAPTSDRALRARVRPARLVSGRLPTDAYLSIYLSIHLSIYLSLSLSIYIYIYRERERYISLSIFVSFSMALA